jgi:hypothetical protein
MSSSHNKESDGGDHWNLQTGSDDEEVANESDALKQRANKRDPPTTHTDAVTMTTNTMTTTGG